jgi:hypothetical protein
MDAYPVYGDPHAGTTPQEILQLKSSSGPGPDSGPSENFH